MALTGVVARRETCRAFVHDRSLGLQSKHALAGHVGVVGARDEGFDSSRRAEVAGKRMLSHGRSALASVVDKFKDRTHCLVAREVLGPRRINLGTGGLVIREGGG